jgi:hypothetical protein
LKVLIRWVPRRSLVSKMKGQRSRTIELYSERPIRSERDLFDFIQALDEDEGIRLEGNLKNHSGDGFVFIGFYRGSYCVNICDRIWNPRLRKFVAGGKDEWFYFDRAKEAFNFVLKEANHPLRGWLY